MIILMIIIILIIVPLLLLQGMVRVYMHMACFRLIRV